MIYCNIPIPNLPNMEGHKHFSHPHNLSYHKSLEGAQLTCTGCNFPCTGTPVYSCRRCKFFLHAQCFDATRSLIHPSHPAHPLSLFPSSTYSNGSFICSSCNQTGSGMCFCCSICEFDLHIHCAYRDLKSNSGKSLNPQNNIQVKAHPNHSLRYLPKPPYANDIVCSCDVCGTTIDASTALYNCGVCEYDVHVGCCDLPETVRREDHEHGLSLLHVNPHEVFECDVCRGGIAQKHCMYYCMSGCDYGMHVQCVAAKVTEKAPMDAMAFQLEMFKLQNQMKIHDMMIETKLLGTHGLHRNRYYRY